MPTRDFGRAVRRPVLALALGLGIASCESPTGVGAVDLRLVAPITGLGSLAFAVRTAPDGSIFLTHGGLLTRIEALGRGRRTETVLGSLGADVALSPDGKVAAATTVFGGELQFVSTSSGGLLATTPVGHQPYRVAFSPSGGDVYVSTMDGWVFRVDAVSHAKVDSIELSGGLEGLAVHPDGTIAVSSFNFNLWLLDPATLDVIVTRNIVAPGKDLVFSRNGGQLFVATENLTGGVLVLHGTSLQTLGAIDFDGDDPIFPFGLALSPDGRAMVVTSPYNGAIALVDVQARRVVRTRSVPGKPRRVSFAADGSRAFIANENGYVNVVR